ncbi:hypothetical protein JMG10_07680 [Nostoc ellipsosporum NOK]|nr:hypothetical protein [Nostoc ellipsosporum NOK]
MKTAIQKIAEERQRQIDKKGYCQTHDQDHDKAELASAAAAYTTSYVVNTQAKASEDKITRRRLAVMNTSIGLIWPFHGGEFKPNYENPIRDLIKAGALIVAEIERIEGVADKPAHEAERDALFYRLFSFAMRTLNKHPEIVDTGDRQLIESIKEYNQKTADSNQPKIIQSSQPAFPTEQQIREAVEMFYNQEKKDQFTIHPYLSPSTLSKFLVQWLQSQLSNNQNK